MNLKGKFRVMVAVAGTGLLAVAASWIKVERSTLLDEKIQKTKELVAIPYSVMEKQYQLESEGKISRSEAQRQTLSVIRSMRYGESNYFWINDEHPTMLMHPMKPELEGKDLSTFKDPTGTAIFVEFVHTARARSVAVMPGIYGRNREATSPSTSSRSSANLLRGVG
jgi:methyl-accepting chemotaxis protein